MREQHCRSSTNENATYLCPTDRLRDVGAHPAVPDSSVEPDVALLSPLSPPGVLDPPEVPAVAVSPVADHCGRVGEGQVARYEEPEVVHSPATRVRDFLSDF